MNPEEPDYDALEEIARKDLAELENTGRQAQPDDPLTVSINSPNTVSVHGNAVAINIKGQEGAASSSNPASGGRLILTLSKNGIPTDYSIDAYEV